MKCKFCAGDFMPTEERCAEVLRELRWKDGVRCPRCHSKKVVKYGKWGQYCQRYRCDDCRCYFNDLTGTIFEGSKIDLREFIYAAKRLLEKESMNQISKELGRTYEAITRVRNLLSDALAKKLVSKLRGEVEIDETYLSAGQKGTKCAERAPRKRGLKLRGRGTYDKDKPPIVALVERDGGVVLKVAEELSREFILELLDEHVAKGSTAYTDDFPMYNELKGYEHHKLNRYSKKEYARGNVHINTAEGVFSLLKSWLRMLRGVRKDRLWRSLKLFEFRFNFRSLDPFDRLSALTGLIL
ncbi:MAG: IS1595 family transposase [Actinomycetota bacterium]|nr:IS1595 family transposase [Actinomycetota bacterium]